MQGRESHCNPNKEFRITLCISPEGWRLFQSPVIMNHKPQILSFGTYTCRPAQFWPGFQLFPPGLIDLIKVSGAELEVITIWLTKSYYNISFIHQSNSLHVSSQEFRILIIISNHPKPSQYTKTTGVLCGVNTAFAPLVVKLRYTVTFWLFSCYFYPLISTIYHWTDRQHPH